MISIVICSNNDARFNAAMQNFQRVFPPDEKFEIVRIPDARSLCEGYNRGLKLSHGDIVAFSHDDIEPLNSDFGSRLRHHLATFDVLGVAGATRVVGPQWSTCGPLFTHGMVAHPYEGGFLVTLYGARGRVSPGIRVLDGVFLAFRREVIEKVGWDEQTFTGFHMYDMDCTFRAFQMGYKLAVALDMPLLHNSHGSFNATWQTHAEAFLKKHGHQMPPHKPRHCCWSAIKFDTKAEAITHMNALIDTLS